MAGDQLLASAPRGLARPTRVTRCGRAAQVHALGLENSRAAVPMSVFWLVPQYAIIGAAEILVNIGAHASARRRGLCGPRVALGACRAGSACRVLLAGGLARASGAVEVGGVGSPGARVPACMLPPCRRGHHASRGGSLAPASSCARCASVPCLPVHAQARPQLFCYHSIVLCALQAQWSCSIRRRPTPCAPRPPRCSS